MIERSFVAPQPVRQTARRRPRFAIAAHEAAHGIVAKRLGWGIRSIDCIPEQLPDGTWRNGKCVLRPPRGLKKTTHLLFQDIVISLAGAAGQRQAGGRRIPSGAGGDLAQVEILTTLLACSVESERALVRHAAAEAKHLVQIEWPSIEAVAMVLLKRGKLTGQEIAAIVAPIEAAQESAIVEHRQRHGRLTVKDLVENRDVDRDEYPRNVLRRHVAEAGLRFLLNHMSERKEQPFSADELDSFLDLWAVRSGFEAYAIKSKFKGALEAHKAAIQWRPVRELTFEGCGISDGSRFGSENGRHAPRHTPALSVPVKLGAKRAIGRNSFNRSAVS